MSHSDHGSAPTTGGGDYPQDTHLIPYSTYSVIWLALCGLTLVTVAVSMVDMRHMTLPVALLVACAKSTLVLLWFMHVKFENKVLWWFIIAGFGTYVIFVILTFADYGYRHHQGL